MPPKKTGRKDARFTMALGLKDQALINRAAKILELPPSVWGRATLLKEAAKIVSTAEAAK